eukprot:6719577-Pyramimonas_sp.AAC.1
MSKQRRASCGLGLALSRAPTCAPDRVGRGCLICLRIFFRNCSFCAASSPRRLARGAALNIATSIAGCGGGCFARGHRRGESGMHLWWRVRRPPASGFGYS